MYRSGDILQDLVFSFLPVSPGGLNSGCEGFVFVCLLNVIMQFIPSSLRLEGICRGIAYDW